MSHGGLSSSEAVNRLSVQENIIYPNGDVAPFIVVNKLLKRWNP